MLGFGWIVVVLGTIVVVGLIIALFWDRLVRTFWAVQFRVEFGGWLAKTDSGRWDQFNERVEPKLKTLASHAHATRDLHDELALPSEDTKLHMHYIGEVVLPSVGADSKAQFDWAKLVADQNGFATGSMEDYLP